MSLVFGGPFMFTQSLYVSYGIDYLLTAVCAIVAFLVELLPPFQRVVFLNDPSIQFPYTVDETIPGPWLPVFCFILPAALVVLICFLSKERGRTMVVALLGLTLAVSSTYLITSILKIYIGKLRPDFLARCKPDKRSNAWNVLCTGNEDLIIAGRKSMPSGHTSTSFAGFGFASFLIAGQFGLFDRKGYTFKFFLFFMPWIAAALIGVSRLRDYRHDTNDGTVGIFNYAVLVGAIIGSITSYMSYLCYFPSPFVYPSDSVHKDRFEQLEPTMNAV